MSEKRISVNDFAQKHGLIKQTVFKVLKRLDIEAEKTRGGSESRGQMISYITETEAKQVLEALAASRSDTSQSGGSETEAALYDVGFFICCG